MKFIHLLTFLHTASGRRIWDSAYRDEIFFDRIGDSIRAAPPMGHILHIPVHRRYTWHQTPIFRIGGTG